MHSGGKQDDIKKQVKLLCVKHLALHGSWPDESILMELVEYVQNYDIQ